MAVEPQYDACFAAEPVTMGPMASEAYRRDPMHLAIALARYKFVARLLDGCCNVAEVGAGDGFGSRLVAQRVGGLALYDFDPAWGQPVIDITRQALPEKYNAIYMLDVIEHIKPDDEDHAVRNIRDSLLYNGVLIAGAPTLEFQPFASAQSRAGHVNCKTGADFKRGFERYFRNVFLFSMNDEMIGTSFPQMACYHFALCTGPR